MAAEYFQPYTEAFTTDPYPVYARLRAEHPVLQSEALGLTLFSRYEDILTLLRDPRLGRAPLGEVTPLPLAQMPHYRRYVSRNLLEREGDTHSRLRCVFAELLTPHRVESLRDCIRRRSLTLLKHAATKGEFDLIADIAVPLTVNTIADLMGWPESTRARLRPWSTDIVRVYERDASPKHEHAAETATAEFAAAVGELIELRKRDPDDDLLSHLARFETQDRLTREELVSSCILLLNAGHEATVNATGNGMLALLRHPAQLERLRRQRNVAGAVEEMLRFDPPLHLFHRFVYEDFAFGATHLRRGDKVGLLYGSANRDAAAFPDPDVFDVGRRRNRHLAFGAETHFCMGAPLARLELHTLFDMLMDRYPDIALAEPTPRYRQGFVFRGLEQLRLSARG